jgi:hypothetical protein
MTKNVDFMGNFVKLEPIFRILVKILEIWVHNTSTIRILSPSAKIYEEVGSAKDVVMVIGIWSDEVHAGVAVESIIKVYQALNI